MNGIWIIPEMHSYILVILMVAYTFMGRKWCLLENRSDTQYFQGWDRMWMNFQDPKSYATVLYSDRDNNGFFDHIEYDLDGDMEMETVIDFKNLGIDDTCELIDISNSHIMIM